MSPGDDFLLDVEPLIGEALHNVEKLSIVVFDQDMRVRAVYGGALTRHGYTPERLVGRRAPDVVPASAWAEIGPLYTRALTGETVTVRLPASDGQAVYDATFQPVRRDGRLVGGMVTSRDVRDEAELEQLRAVAERASTGARSVLEATFATSPVGLCLLAHDGRVLHANEALRRMAGRPELVGGDIRRHARPGELTEDLARFADPPPAGPGEPGAERRYVRPDGSSFWARMTASPVLDPESAGGFSAIQVHDVTEAHELRVQLGETQARTQAILDHTPMAVFLRDVDGRWLSVNRRLAAILGRSAEELDGQTMALTHRPEDQQRFAEDDLAVLADGRTREFDVTFPDASRGGEERHYWLQKFPVFDADGATIGLGGISLDVTDRERAQRELLAARERFAVAFEHAPVGKVISRLEAAGTRSQVIRCNAAFADMLGYRAEELVGLAGPDLTHPDDQHERDRLIAGARKGLRTRGEIRLRHRDGHFVWALIAPAIVTDADGRSEMIIQAIDITERRRLEEQLRYLADHDALTGLIGRRRFSDDLSREVARVKRHGGQASLLLLDLDGFKFVNDAFGHSVGDDLLVRIAHALARVVREGDTLARIGGDEFAILLPETDLDGARIVGTKLLQAVREHGRVLQQGKYTDVTVSIGATSLERGTSPDAEHLLVEADVAMYEAKDAGRDRIVGYQRAARRREHRVRHADWVSRIRDAIRDKHLVLHAQPIVSLNPAADDGEHYELLLRLQDGDKLIPPGAFLYHAERDGLIVDIDRWVLSEAIGILQAADRDGRDLSLSINFSGRTVQDQGLPDELEAMLAGAGLRPGALTVEITETTAITNLVAAGALARRLRGLGCRLALDDFGAGFASFFYLKHLVFDTLKIDGEYIERLPRSATDQLIVRAIVDVAHGLGATVVAERITDEATVTLLRGLGIHHGQGYHLGRPGPLPAGGPRR
jgi:diguanylate cyclase (GGDEF)-like protein/PAS domain S-box-containing protein